MAKRIIKNGEQVFASGVYLVRDTTVKEGWRVVSEIELEADYDGLPVETKIKQNKKGENIVEYFVNY